MAQSFNDNNADVEFDELMALFIVEPTPEPSVSGSTPDPSPHPAFTAAEQASVEYSLASHPNSPQFYPTNTFDNQLADFFSSYQQPRDTTLWQDGQFVATRPLLPTSVAQDEPTYMGPVSPSGSASSQHAHVLSRSSSGRRHFTPSLSDEDRTATSPVSPSASLTRAESDARRREQNRLSAERGRRNRAAQVARMEATIVQLSRERDIWRERVRMMQVTLRRAGRQTLIFPEDA